MAFLARRAFGSTFYSTAITDLLWNFLDDSCNRNFVSYHCGKAMNNICNITHQCWVCITQFKLVVNLGEAPAVIRNSLHRCTHTHTHALVWPTAMISSLLCYYHIRQKIHNGAAVAICLCSMGTAIVQWRHLPGKIVLVTCDVTSDFTYAKKHQLKNCL